MSRPEPGERGRRNSRAWPRCLDSRRGNCCWEGPRPSQRRPCCRSAVRRRRARRADRCRRRRWAVMYVFVCRLGRAEMEVEARAAGEQVWGNRPPVAQLSRLQVHGNSAFAPCRTRGCERRSFGGGVLTRRLRRGPLWGDGRAEGGRWTSVRSQQSGLETEAGGG